MTKEELSKWVDEADRLMTLIEDSTTADELPDYEEVHAVANRIFDYGATWYDDIARDLLDCYEQHSEFFKE